MKDITEIKDSEEIRKIAMQMAQFIFTQSQENLVQPMPWGDDQHHSSRPPTTISDQSIILLSGVPPYWYDEGKIVMEYQAPHSRWVEYGTPPHPVAARHLIGWVNRKLGIRNKKAIGIAYAIANKIRKEGMDPHPFIRPAIEVAIKEYKLKVVNS